MLRVLIYKDNNDNFKSKLDNKTFINITSKFIACTIVQQVLTDSALASRLSSTAPNKKKMGKRRVIVDLDVGTDDAYALLVLLHAEVKNLISIEAIVCSMGNASLENVCNNTVRLLKIFNRTDIPLYKGASTPLISTQKRLLGLAHGVDGFGDLEYDACPDTSIFQTVPAAVAIHNLVLKAPGEVTLVCVGPLTNAALTIKLFDDFAINLKDIYIMGGSYIQGNTTEYAEFNFYTDPESAYIVLNCDQSDIVIVTWETCLKSDITFDWRYSILGICSTPFMDLLNQAEKNIYANETLDAIWYPCDAFLAIALVYPETILSKSRHSGTVELQNEKRGQMILDSSNNTTKNITIIKNINMDIVRERLLEANTNYFHERF